MENSNAAKISQLSKENAWLRLQIESLQLEKYYYLRVLQDKLPNFEVSETFAHDIADTIDS